jgi:DNA helicase II / ATP-dependent DNA helicase PcrA
VIDFHSQLNDKQLEAVLATEGPLLILAGAGSGKTRVITHRIAHLIEKKIIEPERILAVTFTNKAADQMRDRVMALIPSGRSSNPMIATFHSFCVRVLRRNADLLGYTRDFNIYDDSDQLSLVKSCLKEVDLDEKTLSSRNVLSRISFAKNHGQTPADLYQKAFDQLGEKTAVIYELYEKRLRQANSLDFDDLLIKTSFLLESQQQVRERLNYQYPFVMVDEFQDTNRIQYRLIRQMTQRQQNLCVVGDEDQSIYAWRGADIQNILSFERDFPAARIIKLEQNYRSTQIILDAAGAVVSHNRARKGKKLWTENKGGELVTMYEAGDADSEAMFVAQQIKETLRNSPQDTLAVLYRTNFQSRLFEDACQRQNIRYCVVGGFRFYERSEIKDILAYLKLSLNPQDNVALKRIINTPTRGIGKTTLETLESEGRQRNLSIWETVLYALEHKTFPLRTLNALAQFQSVIQELAEEVAQKKLADFLHTLYEKTGYLHWLENEGTEEARARVDNLRELINAARESSERGESIRDFLDHASLVSDADDLDDRARVVLMTLHSAKGLEFSSVFLVGMEEGLFPHSRSMNSDEEIEEERRLCYVGMTRAEKKLFLTRARYRRFLGNESLSATEVSRFVEEIPAQLTDLHLNGHPNRKPVPYQGMTYNNVESIQEFYRRRGKQVDLAPPKKGGTAVAKGIRYGSRLRHPKFGVGSVIRFEGEGEDAKLTVSFPGYGIKKIIRKFVELEEF